MLAQASIAASCLHAWKQEPAGTKRHIDNKIEGQGVGLFAKPGSKLSLWYGKNKAFQEFQLQHEPAFLT